jgi:microcystin degradation protein MlrC
MAGFRVGIGGIVHETNTYATDSFGPTDRDAFHAVAGDALLREHRGTRSCIGGMLDAAADPAVAAVVVPLWWSSAPPSGTIRRDAYELMRDELLRSIEEALPDLDALALDLHGAGVVGEDDDLEVDLGRAIRPLGGPDLPIVATLDLHGNIGDEMAGLYDLMFGYHLYPHTDMWERGDEAMRHLPRLLDRSLRPTTHVEHLPILLPTSTTDPGFPAAEMNDLCRRLESRPGVVDCTVFHGFPFTDVADVGVHVVVTTDDDAPLARAVGAEVGRWIWDNRERFRTESPTPEQAVRLALAADTTTGPVVINETSDNPGGGSPGDGTHLLRALLDAVPADEPRPSTGDPVAVFGFLCDPDAAIAAHAAGTGTTIELRLGGKHDELHGLPLDVTAYVKALTDGRFVLRSMSAGTRVNLGRSARLVIGGPRGNVEVIVTERRSQTLDAEIFRLHGIDVTACRIVALKSSNHFRAGFRDVASQIVTADAPGLTTNRVEVFEHRRATVPLWPQDPAAAYEPSTA